MIARTLLTAMLASALLALVGATAADAQTTRFTIVPTRSIADPRSGAFFAYTADRGATISDSATILNQGDSPLSLQVYAADAVTAIGGGTAFAAAGEVRQNVRAWLSAELATVSVPARGRLDVPFSVAVPSDARAGDHVAGWVVEGPPIRAAVSSDVTTAIVPRVGVAVVVHVNGAAASKLSAGELCLNQESGSEYFQLAVANSGDLLTKGAGSLTLATTDARPVLERAFDLGSVLPRDSTFLRIDAPQAILPGRYVATVRVRQPAGEEVALDTAITVPERRVNGCAIVDAAPPAPPQRAAAPVPPAAAAAGSNTFAVLGPAIGGFAAATGLLGLIAGLRALRRRP